MSKQKLNYDEIEQERERFAQWFDRQKTGHNLVLMSDGVYDPYFAQMIWAGWIAAKNDVKSNSTKPSA